MLECIGVFILVFCVVFGVCCLVDGGEQTITNECKKIIEDNAKTSMEIMFKSKEE